MLSAGLLEPLVGVKCTRTICHRLNAVLAEALKECMKPAQDLTRENIRHRNSPNDSGNEARPIVGLRKRAGGESAGDAAVARSSVSSVSTYGHCRLPVCSTMLLGTERGNSAFAVKAACKCCRESGHTAHCSRAKRVGGCCSVKTVQQQVRWATKTPCNVLQNKPYPHNPGETGRLFLLGYCQASNQ